MQTDLPAWALRIATADDYNTVVNAHRRGTMRIRWPDQQTLRNWTRHAGWPTPRLGFENAVITQLLANEANFARALAESGIVIDIPRQDVAMTAAQRDELDALYAARSPSGRPTDWGILVEALRDIRRAVEAGVVVRVDEAHTLRTWQDFYAWAHGRYHALEDGYDRWIGDDA
jgi:hypothetical protein